MEYIFFYISLIYLNYNSMILLIFLLMESIWSITLIRFFYLNFISKNEYLMSSFHLIKAIIFFYSSFKPELCCL
jgi:hypothetical protein